MSSHPPQERPSDARPDDPSTASARGAASAALRRTAVALTHARAPRDTDRDTADHWPLDGPLSGTAESRERLACTGERQIWVEQDSAETDFARAVAAYTRLLRDGGMRPRQVLVTVAAAVREAAAPSSDADRLDGTIHDAGRYCVEAYFAR